MNNNFLKIIQDNWKKLKFVKLWNYVFEKIIIMNSSEWNVWKKLKFLQCWFQKLKIQYFKLFYWKFKDSEELNFMLIIYKNSNLIKINQKIQT